MLNKHVRREILDIAVKTKNGHIASAFSIVEILVVLYNWVLKPNDRFILSKGHGCMALYPFLKQRGYNPKLKQHPDIDIKNGIWCSTGSLGHGLPIGVGMAFAKKLMNKNDNVYVLMSDGECQEGTTWESLLFAKQHNLDNLTIIIDYNKIQALDRVDNILSLDNLKAKFKAFGCNTIELINGHDVVSLKTALSINNKTKKPMVIVCNTKKGKGVSFIEDKPDWHNYIPKDEQLEKAYEELS